MRAENAHVEEYTLKRYFTHSISRKESQISVSYKLRHALEKLKEQQQTAINYLFFIFCQRSNERLYQGNLFKLNFRFNLEKL